MLVDFGAVPGSEGPDSDVVEGGLSIKKLLGSGGIRSSTLASGEFSFDS